MMVAAVDDGDVDVRPFETPGSEQAAETAAMAIKTGHPIVSVVVYDAKAGENHVMELAKK